MKKLLLLVLALCSGRLLAEIVDCADESAFAVIGRADEQSLDVTARSLEQAIVAREGKAGYSVSVQALPADEAAAREALKAYCQTLKKDPRVKRLATLVTPAVYETVTNLLTYGNPVWPNVTHLPMGWNKHADMLEFTPGAELTPDVMNFVCGYQIDWANPVCSFESGEPSLTAAEAMAAMEAGDWVDTEVEKTRNRIVAWAGTNPVALVAFECDTHVYSPVRGKWPMRASLLEGNFRHAKRLARAAKTLKVDVAAELGDLGYDFSGRHWKHACKGERAARMALQCAAYDLFELPFMAVQGNHDCHWETLDGFGRLFNPEGAKRTRGFVFGPTRGYGYYDLPEKKVRLFFVNTSESGTGGDYAIRPEQLVWIRSAVDATPDGSTVAFFSHDCLHRTAGDKDWKERAGCKASKTYGDMRALLVSVAAGTRLRLAGAWCGDSHMNRLHEEKGVKYFICDAAFGGKGPKKMLAHVAAINVRTGEGRLFRIGAGGAKGDL